MTTEQMGIKVDGVGFLFRSIDESNLSSTGRFIWSQHRMNNLSVNNGGIDWSEFVEVMVIFKV